MRERLSDWQTRLAEYLESSRGLVASGDVELCALFAAGAVEAVTGENPADQFRGKYREVADNLERTIDTLFDAVPVPLAQTGDIAFDGEAIGVVYGPHAMFIAETTGGEVKLAAVPRSDLVKVWGVGRV